MELLLSDGTARSRPGVPRGGSRGGRAPLPKPGPGCPRGAPPTGARAERVPPGRTARAHSGRAPRGCPGWGISHGGGRLLLLRGGDRGADPRRGGRGRSGGLPSPVCSEAPPPSGDLARGGGDARRVAPSRRPQEDAAARDPPSEGLPRGRSPPPRPPAGVGAAASRGGGGAAESPARRPPPPVRLAGGGARRERGGGAGWAALLRACARSGGARVNAAPLGPGWFFRGGGCGEREVSADEELPLAGARLESNHHHHHHHLHPLLIN